MQLGGYALPSATIRRVQGQGAGECRVLRPPPDALDEQSKDRDNVRLEV